MRYKLAIFPIVTAAILFMAGAVIPVNGYTADRHNHPELSEQDRLIPCQQCHKKVTPEVYKEWYKSDHGIAMVKCYQCHGSFENFRLTPAISACDSCHSDMVEKCPTKKPCWGCHTPHKFEEHK
ncbi:MAG: multiheme C-type cytochrome [Desulfobia sp.]